MNQKLLLIIATVCIVTQSGFSANITWTGAAGDGLWTTGGNFAVTGIKSLNPTHLFLY